MSITTVKNRYESYIKVQENPETLYAKVLEFLQGKMLSAKEIAKGIGLNTRQDIQPRLNELRDKLGLIEEAGEKRDEKTNRTVTIYKLSEIKKMEMENMNHIPRI